MIEWMDKDHSVENGCTIPENVEQVNAILCCRATNRHAGENSGLRKERNFDNHIGTFRMHRESLSGLGEVGKRKGSLVESSRGIRSWKP